ncbi:MAG: asparagine synthase (glutamine-hydrolyzing) [bacterium]
MCGIFGFLDFQNRGGNAQILRAMSHSIAHRGPDDYGYVFFDLLGNQQMVGSQQLPEQEDFNQFNGILVLGHRRLAIIDLTEAGHQPMSNESKRIWITYNGEIYNYKELTEELKGKGHLFKSCTDTEVILHAYEEWGIECLPRFNGMWAFALWDMDRKRLFCARDRFGIKPFYYWFNGMKFILASEIKAILQDPFVPRAANNDRVYDYLCYGYLDHTEDTFFQGIYQLRGGHYLTLELLGANDFQLDIRPYWDLIPKECELKDDFKERFYELLEDSVRLHMRSDVPVGTCLSGGIDSSSIVSLAKNFLGSNLHKTFSSCFDDKEYDEREYINKVVELTDSEPHYVFPKPDLLFREIEDLIWHQDEPFGSTSIYAQWNVFKLAKSNQVKVILDGQGADELLAGYHPYFGFYLSELAKTFRFQKFIEEYKKVRSLHHYSHSWIIGHLMLCLSPLPWSRVIRNQVLLYKNKWLNACDYSTREIEFQQKYKNILFDRLYQSLMYLTLPGLLHYEDRNSMAHSIEARVPFLDYRLVEFVFSLPMDQIIRNGTTKVILREAMKGVIPETVRTRLDKIGFVTPENIWFRGALKDHITEIIFSRSFEERGYFNIGETRRTFMDYLEGKRGAVCPIWRWVNLELWFRKFIDQEVYCRL